MVKLISRRSTRLVARDTEVLAIYGRILRLEAYCQGDLDEFPADALPGFEDWKLVPPQELHEDVLLWAFRFRRTLVLLAESVLSLKLYEGLELDRQRGEFVRACDSAFVGLEASLSAAVPHQARDIGNAGR